MSDGEQARDPVDGATEIVVVPLLRSSCVQGHTDTQRGFRIPGFGIESLLGRQRSLQCAPRRCKGGAEGIADRLEDHAAVRLDSQTQQGIVTLQCRTHALRRGSPEPGAAFDVGKQKCYDAGRQIQCHGSPSRGALTLTGVDDDRHPRTARIAARGRDGKRSLRWRGHRRHGHSKRKSPVFGHNRRERKRRSRHEGSDIIGGGHENLVRLAAVQLIALDDIRQDSPGPWRMISVAFPTAGAVLARSRRERSFPGISPHCREAGACRSEPYSTRIRARAIS